MPYLRYELLLILVQYRKIQNPEIPEKPKQAGFRKTRDADISQFADDRSYPDRSALNRKTAHKNSRQLH
jgi:hypothetical protein